jgi:hypothetical protein
LEWNARDALKRALDADQALMREFWRILHISAKKVPPALKLPVAVKKERRLRNGGKIDLLLTSGTDALIVEVKVWDSEKLHQYITVSPFPARGRLPSVLRRHLGKKERHAW